LSDDSGVLDARRSQVRRKVEVLQKKEKEIGCGLREILIPLLSGLNSVGI